MIKYKKYSYWKTLVFFNRFRFRWGFDKIKKEQDKI